jgi:putative ABC transport system permease protein
VLKQRIAERTGLAAYTAAELKSLTISYFVKNTGIPINFGMAVGLGFLVGVAIVGQTFYSFVIDNLRYIGILKAMGASNGLLFNMILLQTAIVGCLGCGMGMGIASLTSILSKNSELAFYMPWQIPVLTVLATAVITLLATMFSIGKVVRLEPGIVFRG